MAGKPGVPVAGKPGLPVTGKPGMPMPGKPVVPPVHVTPAPIAHAPVKAPLPQAGITPHDVPSMASAQASMLSGVTDPFAGYPKPPPPPKQYHVGPGGQKVIDLHPPKILIYPLPGVNNVPTSGGDKFFTDPETSLPVVRQQQVAFDLGRSAGWVAGDAQGRVTAYFESRDGAMVVLNVGSEIGGFQVKAINVDKHYLLLVNPQTGSQQKVRLTGERRAPAH